MFQVLGHTCSDDYAANPAKEPARPDREKYAERTALVALAASSDMCTAESNPPMVHMGDSQDNMNAHPVGHVVRFSTWVKIYDALLRALAPIGSAIMVARMRTKFITTKTVWSLPITRAMVEAIRPWVATVARKVA